jgi:cell division septal protein FtsQ
MREACVEKKKKIKKDFAKRTIMVEMSWIIVMWQMTFDYPPFASRAQVSLVGNALKRNVVLAEEVNLQKKICTQFIEHP